MPKKVTSIDFVFENCEVGTLPINAVPSFYFDDVTKSISHRWLFESGPVDEVETTISCKYAHFQIDYELAKKVQTNAMELFDENIEENNLAKRLLRWNDLTSVTLNFSNKTSTNIYFPFDEVKLNEWDEDNKLQKSKLVKYDSWEIIPNKAYKNHDMIIIEIGKCNANGIN